MKRDGDQARQEAVSFNDDPEVVPHDAPIVIPRDQEGLQDAYEQAKGPIWETKHLMPDADSWLNAEPQRPGEARRKRKRWLWIISFVLVAVCALAVGIGAGVGVSHKSHGSA